MKLEEARQILKAAIDSNREELKTVSYMENGDAVIVSEEFFPYLPVSWMDVKTTVSAEDLMHTFNLETELLGAIQDAEKWGWGFVRECIEEEMDRVSEDCNRAIQNLCTELPELREMLDMYDA